MRVHAIIWWTLLAIAVSGVGLLLLPRVLVRSEPLVGWAAPSIYNTCGLFLVSGTMGVLVLVFLVVRVSSWPGKRFHLFWVVPVAVLVAVAFFVALLLATVFVPYPSL